MSAVACSRAMRASETGGSLKGKEQAQGQLGEGLDLLPTTYYLISFNLLDPFSNFGPWGGGRPRTVFFLDHQSSFSKFLHEQRLSLCRKIVDLLISRYTSPPETEAVLYAKQSSIMDGSNFFPRPLGQIAECRASKIVDGRGRVVGKRNLESLFLSCVNENIRVE